MSRPAALPAEPRDGCPAVHHDDYNAVRNYGCTCPPAVQAMRRYNRDCARRSRRAGSLITGPVGSMRRLQALAAVGWSLTHVAAVSGLSVSAMKETAHGHRKFIRRDTAEVIAAVYVQLSGDDGTSAQQRGRARVRGWVGPEAWTPDSIDDPAASPWQEQESEARDFEIRVERLCAGKPVLGPSPAERRAAVRVLNSRGFTDVDIAARIGMASRNVLRIRGELGLPANRRAA